MDVLIHNMNPELKKKICNKLDVEKMLVKDARDLAEKTGLFTKDEIELLWLGHGRSVTGSPTEKVLEKLEGEDKTIQYLWTKLREIGRYDCANLLKETYRDLETMMFVIVCLMLLVLVDVVNGDDVFPCLGNQYGIKSKSGKITCKFCDLRAKCPRGQGVSYYIKCRSLIPAGTHSHCEVCKFRETYSSTFDSRPCQKCPKCHENEATTGWCNQYSNTISCTGQCKQGFYTLSGQVKDCQPCSTCQFQEQVKLAKCKDDNMPSSKQCEKMIENVTTQPSLISPTSQAINHNQQPVAIETASSGSSCDTLCIIGCVVVGTLMIIALIWIIYSKCLNSERRRQTTCYKHHIKYQHQPELTQPASGLTEIFTSTMKEEATQISQNYKKKSEQCFEGKKTQYICIFTSVVVAILMWIVTLFSILYEWPIYVKLISSFFASTMSLIVIVISTCCKLKNCIKARVRHHRISSHPSESGDELINAVIRKLTEEFPDKLHFHDNEHAKQQGKKAAEALFERISLSEVFSCCCNEYCKPSFDDHVVHSVNKIRDILENQQENNPRVN